MKFIIIAILLISILQTEVLEVQCASYLHDDQIHLEQRGNILDLLTNPIKKVITGVGDILKGIDDIAKESVNDVMKFINETANNIKDSNQTNGGNTSEGPETTPEQPTSEIPEKPEEKPKDEAPKTPEENKTK